MHFKTRTDNGVLVIKPLDKRLDDTNIPEFKEKMAFYISDGKRKFILDLSHVEFMTSPGVGAIVAAHRSLNGKGRLAITGLDKMIKPLFKLLHLQEILDIHHTNSAAFKALAKVKEKK